jgi:hypothetical protein
VVRVLLFKGRSANDFRRERLNGLVVG